jgi:aquaporin Z
VVFTAIFLLVIFGSTSTKNIYGGFAGLAIGLSLVLIHIVGIPVTGVSVNPARSIGPALFAGGVAISQLWLFIVAPILGSILAAVIWRYFVEKTDSLKA